MEAGRELDALVGREIFGIKKLYYEDWDTGQTFPKYIPSGKPWRTHSLDAVPLPRFSSNIAAAWQVVEKMKWMELSRGIADFYACKFRIYDPDNLDSYQDFEGFGDTAPLAICLAALKAVGVDVDVENPSKSV